MRCQCEQRILARAPHRPPRKLPRAPPAQDRTQGQVVNGQGHNHRNKVSHANAQRSELFSILTTKRRMGAKNDDRIYNRRRGHVSDRIGYGENFAVRRRITGTTPHSHIGKTSPIVPLKQMPRNAFRGRRRTIMSEGRNSSIIPERSVPIKTNGTPSSTTLRKAGVGEISETESEPGIFQERRADT
jgi:hypothetical protein